MIDPVEKFIRLVSYKFDKGYPDVENTKDKETLFRLVEELTQEKPKANQGYRVGSFQHPVETLESRNWSFINKTGYLGTGYYFYGDLENAKEDSTVLANTRTPEIIAINLDTYKLYKPKDAEHFYDTISEVTKSVGEAAPSIEEEDIKTEEVQEALQEVVDIITKELGLQIQEGTVMGILAKFIRDVREKNNGTMLSNRLLTQLGYEGIDNRNTPLDNYGVGSVLFTVKPETLKKLPSSN